MKSNYKYTITYMQKRDYEEVGSGLKWAMLGLVAIGCIVLYNLVDLG